MPGLKFKVFNEGYPGINTSVIISNLEANLKRYNPDIVITMMGANDGVPYLSYRDSYLGRIPVLSSLSTLRLITQTYRVLIYRALEFSADTILHYPYLYILAGKYCLSQGLVLEAERVLNKAVAKFPNNPTVYTALGEYYKNRNLDLRKAIDIFKLAIAKGANDNRHYRLLGRAYYNIGDIPEAIKSFQRGVELDSGDVLSYVDLGKAIYLSGKKVEAEELFKKAIQLAPLNDKVYYDIGNFYVFQAYKYDDTATKKIGQFKWFFDESIRNNPRNWEAYNVLAMYYYKMKQYQNAEEMYKNVIRVNPNFDIAYSGLGRVYAETNQPELALEYNNKAKEVRLSKYNPIMRYNYLKLKDVLVERKIRLVVVQYPLRPVQQFINILESNNPDIIYVDNEDIFRNIVNKDGYDKYFVDAGAGDFGHCTPEGNRILAGNIARVIINEWFKADKK